MLQFIKGDIQSGDLLSYILDTENIDTVMHFAAQVRACEMYTCAKQTAVELPCKQAITLMGMAPADSRGQLLW